MGLESNTEPDGNNPAQFTRDLNMKKTLKIEVISRTKENVTFKITEQSHREAEFGDDGNRFNASNGIDLFSAMIPEWEPYADRLYVRGGNKHFNGSKVTTTSADFDRIEKAIAEYNAFEFED